MSGTQVGSPLKPIRYRNKSALSRFFTAFALFALAWAVWLIWTGATWSYGNFNAPTFDFSGVLSLVGGVFVGGLGLLGLFASLRAPAILTGEVMRLPKGFRHVSIPVQEITGVGLVFKRNSGGRGGSLPSGWYLMVWPGDREPQYAGISYVPAIFRRGKQGGGNSRSLSAAKFDPVADTDVRQLASTHAAQVAHDIYDHVMARQGLAGPLAVRQMQKHVHAGGPWGTSPIVAWWSPDGNIGLAGGAPGPRI